MLGKLLFKLGLPQRMWYLGLKKLHNDDMGSIVVAAPDKASARTIAAGWHLGEGKSVWLDPKDSVCYSIGLAWQRYPNCVMRGTVTTGSARGSRVHGNG